MAYKQFSAQNVSCVEVEKLVIWIPLCIKEKTEQLEKKKKKRQMVGFSHVNAPEFLGVPLRPKLILLVTSLLKWKSLLFKNK